MRKELCKCGNIKERIQAGQCNTCHSAYTNKWKKDHPLTEEQKAKAKETRRKYENKLLEGKRQRSPRLGAKPGILRPLCSWCDAVIEGFKKKTFCKPCAAKYNREWRKRNPRTEEDNFKDNVRVKTRYRILRGILKKEPCEKCGEIKVEAHHDDYNKPFEIRWLCVFHHHEHHSKKRKNDVTSGENNK
jgi:ribosomal protein S27AE